MDSLAVELRGGYAYSKHSSLADDVRTSSSLESKEAVKTVNDISDLWEMKSTRSLAFAGNPSTGRSG